MADEAEAQIGQAVAQRNLHRNREQPNPKEVSAMRTDEIEGAHPCGCDSITARAPSLRGEGTLTSGALPSER
jgi:hypothetical protein